MMMARDSNSDQPNVSPESLHALQNALARYLQRDGDLEHVRPALHRIAVEARERHILAEQLLITLKDVWYALPDVRTGNTEAQQERLQRVVTTCIREYYSVDESQAD